VRIEGSLAADGSGTLSVNASLEPRMTFLISSFAAAGGQANSVILDSSLITQSMSGAPGIASVNFRNTAPAAIEGQVVISMASDFLALTDDSFIIYEHSQYGGRCVININRDNGPALLDLLSAEIKNYLNVLMAPLATGESMTKTEYLQLVASFFNRLISEEIASSRISASIDFPGVITSVKGGTFSGRRANFDIPLIDLLVLETPVIYEVIWN
jgi:hypothetical protein